MNTLIIYRSKTGFTQQYAQWIKDDLHCDMLPWHEAVKRDLSGYGRIIYGSSFHAGIILGLKKFFELEGLQQKKLIVFATGAFPAESPDIAAAMRKNFTDEQWQKIKTFYFPSGLCYERMSLGDKAMMAVFRTMVKKQEGENSQTYQIVKGSFDNSDKSYVQPLITYCRS